ncbi:hypothetical protein OAT67_03390 [Bacteriovoracaceae bacterium]|nr:hypothetical protein [Bacteriovoracaceae bacterium]
MKKIITGLLLTTCLLSSCGKDQKTEIVGGLGSGNNQGQDVNNQNVQLEDSFKSVITGVESLATNEFFVTKQIKS